jgi:type IV secretory pathway VirB9-like protein
MKRIALSLAVLTVTQVSATAQKIGTEAGDRARIVHLKTALNHLTVIEVGEPVVEVAAGSPTFKVEWRDNKVFVQPTEADAATNLFIWTATQRLSYELEPADP